MAILQSALVEPLLSRQQSVVVRDIARVAQLAEAYKSLQNIEDAFMKSLSNGIAKTSLTSNCESIKGYLQAEAIRVLMQIKTPTVNVDVSKVDTTAPGKTQ